MCAWQYVYGDHPITEAYVGAAAVKDGADCLMIDAEAQYEGKYVSAQAYMTRLRKLVGHSYPIALAGFPYVDYHPAFPYSVFLGPGGAQLQRAADVLGRHRHDASTPCTRTRTGTTASTSARSTRSGRCSTIPRAGQIKRFRQMSRSYGSRQRQLVGLAGGDQRRLAGAVTADRRTARVRPQHHVRHARDTRARGVVVWAQEHLVSAGQRLAIDGSFGPATFKAVESFQAGHGLPVDGLIGQATWSALLRYSPVRVHWVHRGRRIVASLSRGRTQTLPVPKSAKLHAKRNEIPAPAAPAGLSARADRARARTRPGRPATCVRVFC